MTPLTFKTVQESVKNFLDKNPSYSIHDISSELFRDVYLPNFSMRIEQPVALIMRKGGTTHRIITRDGRFFCYASPERGNSIVSWAANIEDGLIQF